MEISLLKDTFVLNKSRQSNINKCGNAYHSNKTQMKERNSITLNEINISNKIKQIPYFFNYYDIVSSYQVSNNALCYNKHLILTYSNEDTYDNSSNTFKDVLLTLQNPKQIILYCLQTYIALLNSLLLLEKNGITYFGSNISFNNTTSPMLHNFENSILNDQLNEKYITDIIKNTTDYTYKPIEIHLLFYLIMNDESSLSYTLLYEIIDRFIENMPILVFFSLEFREKYKIECIDLLTKYINKSRSEIIKDVMKYYNTWDNYSVSVLYLHIFINALQTFSLEKTFISELINSLSKNISVYPWKRETATDTLNNYNKLFNTGDHDWKFINKITYEKVASFRLML